MGLIYVYGISIIWVYREGKGTDAYRAQASKKEVGSERESVRESKRARAREKRERERRESETEENEREREREGVRATVIH